MDSEGWIYTFMYTYIHICVIIIKGKDAINLKGNKRGHDPVEGRPGEEMTEERDLSSHCPTSEIHTSQILALCTPKSLFHV